MLSRRKWDFQKKMCLLSADIKVDRQKGLNLIMDEIDEMMKEDIQFVLLGAGDEYYETGFKKIQEKYPDKVGVYIGFNAPLAQRIMRAVTCSLCRRDLSLADLGSCLA